ncbi:PH domain-containing protein [Natronobacterium gregoryi]|uniref:Bacterial Pleckstrin homology domain-containing protein n=2 Tax=Natronobacterium gregoryi TaxID=44930 RepID=L0AC05_NATGS|nr:PH domain-containing protein [Natronobacterium gregoryi]AFZ71433.1 Protein of unknown function (DUF1696) [Natronobacterium gregoryi SP2]ELY66736.1 hypothetical protein C490_12005 [Natronobacterium gregoryi SP2]PLK19974.1 hypothetical protein CYV19_12250 [Natronobacterium gregoryi SP2]SFJ35775.1 PH domain-containing protein [Natronobacterium gregoryi]
MGTQQQYSRLESFIDSNETTIDGYQTQSEAGVLTNRQLISLKTTGRDNSKTTVNSVYLDQVSRAKIEHQKTPDVDQERLAYGIVSLFLAIISFALIGQFDSNIVEVTLVMVGVCVGLVGIALFIEAYDTPDDSVYIELQTPDGEPVWKRRLGGNQLEFAEKLSRTVSNAHDPSNQIAQKIGT